MSPPPERLHPDPERHVNRSENPNVYPDFVRNANVALRDIEIGEESDDFRIKTETDNQLNYAIKLLNG